MKWAVQWVGPAQYGPSSATSQPRALGQVTCPQLPPVTAPATPGLLTRFHDIRFVPDTVESLSTLGNHVVPAVQSQTLSE